MKKQRTGYAKKILESTLYNSKEWWESKDMAEHLNAHNVNCITAAVSTLRAKGLLISEKQKHRAVQQNGINTQPIRTKRFSWETTVHGPREWSRY